MPEESSSVLPQQGQPQVSSGINQDTAVLGDVTPETAAPEPPGTGVETEAATPEEPQAPAIDWEAIARQNQMNFQGLQGRVQREVEQSRQLQARVQELESALFEAATANLDPQQRQIEAQRFQQFQAVQAQQRQLQQREFELSVQQQMQQQQVDEYYRNEYAKLLARDHGVPAAELLDFPTPQAMEVGAKKLAKTLRQARVAQRAASRSDSFEGSNTAAAPQKPAANLDEAGADFVATMRRLTGR